MTANQPRTVDERRDATAYQTRLIFNTFSQALVHRTLDLIFCLLSRQRLTHKLTEIACVTTVQNSVVLGNLERLDPCLLDCTI